MITGTLLCMTSYEPVAATRVTPAKLAITAGASLVLSLLLIIGGVGFFAAYSAPLVIVFSAVGRLLFVASVVLAVLAVVRRLDRR